MGTREPLFQESDFKLGLAPHSLSPLSPYRPIVPLVSLQWFGPPQSPIFLLYCVPVPYTW